MCMYKANKNISQRKGSHFNGSLILEVVVKEVVKILKIERKKMKISVSVRAVGEMYAKL